MFVWNDKNIYVSTLFLIEHKILFIYAMIQLLVLTNANDLHRFKHYRRPTSNFIEPFRNSIEMQMSLD